MLFACRIWLFSGFVLSFLRLLLSVWSNWLQKASFFCPSHRPRSWRSCNLTFCCVRNLALHGGRSDFISIRLFCCLGICIRFMFLFCGGSEWLLDIGCLHLFYGSLHRIHLLLILKVVLFFGVIYWFGEWKGRDLWWGVGELGWVDLFVQPCYIFKEDSERCDDWDSFWNRFRMPSWIKDRFADFVVLWVVIWVYLEFASWLYHTDLWLSIVLITSWTRTISLWGWTSSIFIIFQKLQTATCNIINDYDDCPVFM